MIFILFAVDAAQNAYANKEVCAAFFGAATPALTYLLDKRKKQAETGEAQLTVTLEIDGTAMTIEGRDAEDIVKLAEAFKTMHPQIAAKATTKSAVRVTGKRHHQHKKP